MSQSPQFEHDCNECVFLGPHKGADLYWCAKIPTLPTVIARYSDKPSDNQSGLGMIEISPDLTEAAHRAFTKGLFTLDQALTYPIGERAKAVVGRWHRG